MGNRTGISKSLLLLLALVLLRTLVTSAAVAGSTPEPLPPMTAEKWRADVDFLARELPKRHKNAYHSVKEEAFAAAVASLRARAEGASDAAMLVGLMQLTAMVGDGHTRVNLPSGLHQYPIGVTEIEDRQRIVRGAGPAAELVGGTLVKIDDTPLEQAIERIRTILPQHESELSFAAFTPQWFSVPEVLHGLGIARSASGARFTARMDDGSERSADVTALAADARPEWKVAAASQPLYRQKPGESFWFEWMPEKKTIYVNWRSYQGLGKKAKEMWAFVDANPVEKIVIDLRQNGGGDFFEGKKHLVDPLAARARLRGYVITGSRTYSAALKNAIDFRTVAKATLVGATIAERPNSYSENDEMRLPQSRIEVSYSTKYYTFLPEDGKLVEPDKEILPTWADWVAGRDPVLEWILAQ